MANFKKLFFTMLIVMLGKPDFAETIGKTHKQGRADNGLYIGVDIGLLTFFHCVWMGYLRLMALIRAQPFLMIMG